MADKIIPLNPNGNESEKIKFSDILYDFVEPFIDRYPDNVSLDEIFWDGVAAWNIAVMTAVLPDPDRKEALQMEAEDNPDNSFFWELIERKDSVFSIFDHIYEHIEFEREDGVDHLIVRVTSSESLFDQMIQDLAQPFESKLDDDGVVNRIALVISPKQKLIDWVNNLYPDDPITGATLDPNIYLISDEKEEPDEEYFKKRFDRYFKMELENWHPNKKEWPQRRTYKIFNEWFDVKVSAMIYDLEKTPLLKF